MLQNSRYIKQLTLAKSSIDGFLDMIADLNPVRSFAGHGFPSGLISGNISAYKKILDRITGNTEWCTIRYTRWVVHLSIAENYE